MLMSLSIQVQQLELPRNTQKNITWTDIFRDRNDHSTICRTTGFTNLKIKQNFYETS